MLEKKTRYVVGLGVGGLAVLLHIIGIATNFWISSLGSNAGLWESCSSLWCVPFQDVSGRLGGARATCILGLLGAVSKLAVCAVRLFLFSLSENKIIQHLPSCLLMAAGCMGLLGVSLFCLEHQCYPTAGYSLGLAIVGSILYVVVCVLLEVPIKSSSVKIAT